MNMNATLIGQIIFLLVIPITLLGYYLGKRKTQTPILTAVLAFFSAFVPPVALIFFIVLVVKSDVEKPEKVA
ncbi:hypothetical protein [Alteromonas oceanisediminis]|uniref:hypothetical protein n=1 Tax=Alteromonas oceanisediminis TaxID=2836180 RepID=UPI001BDAAA2E|nr:hypothetical protein [Alteromonas oceanisediminis]MBT0585598.1 hypothetical protein [Alteromonas oceanisediminis]